MVYWRRIGLSIGLVLLLAMIVSSCGPRPAEETDLDPADRVREIEFYVTTADYDPFRYEYGIMVAEEWRKLGFQVKVTPLAWPTLSERGIQQKEYDVFTLQWAGTAHRLDPDHFVYVTSHSEQVGVGQFNIPGFQNAEYDRLAEAQRLAMDPEERRQIVFEAQAMFAEYLPWAPVLFRYPIHAYNSAEFTNVTAQLGEGLMGFWNWVTITPTGARTTAHLGYPSDVTIMNPLTSTNAHDHQTMRKVYELLTRTGPDGAIEMAAAQSYDIVTDTVLDFYLRPGMKFHDGQPVTARDVAYTYELIKKVESPFFRGLVGFIESVEAVDDLTVRFTLTEPTATFLTNTLTQVYILPEHVWEPIYQAGGAEAVLNHTNEEAIGSGPFKMDYWRRDEEMMLIAIKDHFLEPKIDRLLKVPYASVLGMLDGLKAGQIDAIGWTIEPLQAEEVQRTAGLDIVEVPNHGIHHINYNMRRRPFDDVAVRLALSHAVPKERILNDLLEGYGVVAHSYIAPSNEFWYNPDVRQTNYDLDLARQILADAGYRWDSEGRIYYPEGKGGD